MPPHDRVRVLLPAEAALPGEALIQVAAVSGDFADAAELRLPVWTPATSEAFATYGQLESGAAAQAIRVPMDVYPQFGGLKVTTSSTALASLTDAVLYLTDYRFPSAEPLASRILAISALSDVLAAFGSDLDPQKLKKRVDEDIKDLAAIQNGDGGFGFWRRGERSWPYLTIHVSHALVRTQAAGHQLPGNM